MQLSVCDLFIVRRIITFPDDGDLVGAVFEVSVDAVATRLASDRRLRGAQRIQTFRLLTLPSSGPTQRTSRSGDVDQDRYRPTGRPTDRPTDGAFNDPYSNLQHSVTSLRLAGVHRRATGDGVRVAVVDTGIDVDHPELQGKISRARNFVDEGQESFTTDVHGTAVAGVIAASVNNGIGIVGIAPGVELLALKACWQESPNDRAAVCNSYTLAKAFDFALREGVDVINLSLTGPDDPLLERLIDRAVKRGVVVIAAAQVNGGGDPESASPVSVGSFGFPASMPSVLAVRSSDLSERLSEPVDSGHQARRAETLGAGSGGGPEVNSGGVSVAGANPQTLAEFAREDLAAPGIDVLTTVPRDSYDFLSGSSLAAAHASGIAALLLEVDPDIAPQTIRDILRQTGRPIGSSDAAEALSVGRLIDACAAVEAVVGESVCVP